LKLPYTHGILFNRKSSISFTLRVMLIFVRRLQCSLRRQRRRVTRRRRQRTGPPLQKRRRKPPRSSSFKLLGSTTYLPKGGGCLDHTERRLPALRSGFLKRPANLAGQPARSDRQSRRKYRSSVSFALTYASLINAVHLPRGKGDFPDNYCLEKSGTKNWYHVTCQPSLRAARRMVMMGLDNPGSIMTPLPYTIWELSNKTPKVFQMIEWTVASGIGSTFAKPGMACCHTRRCYQLPLGGSSWKTELLGNGAFHVERGKDPLSHGRKVLSTLRVTFPDGFDPPGHKAYQVGVTRLSRN